MPSWMDSAQWGNAPESWLDSAKWSSAPATTPSEQQAPAIDEVPRLDAQGDPAPIPSRGDVAGLQADTAAANYAAAEANKGAPAWLQGPTIADTAAAQPAHAFEAKFGQGTAQPYVNMDVGQPATAQPSGPAMFSREWWAQELGATGDQPYGQGVGYLIDNPVTRGLGQFARETDAALSNVAARGAGALGLTRAQQFLEHEAEGSAAAGQQLAAPEGSVGGAITQAGTRLGANLLLGASTAGTGAEAQTARAAGGLMDMAKTAMRSPAARMAATLGATQAGNEAAQLEAQGQQVSDSRLIGMAALDTAANMIPLAGRSGIAKRIASGALVGEGTNEALNLANDRPVGTGAVMATATGAALGVLPGHHRVTLADEGRALGTQVRFDDRMGLLRDSVARKDFEDRMDQAAQQSGGFVHPATATQLARTVAGEHGTNVEALLRAPPTPMDAGAVAADAALREARQTAAAATPDIPATPEATSPIGNTPSPDAVSPDLSPRAPALPDLPSGVTRDELVQQWRAARTDTEKQAAAARIAAFDHIAQATSAREPFQMPDAYDWQTPLSSHEGLSESQRTALGASYRRAERTLPGFASALDDIASGVNGRAIVAPLKGVPRTVAKVLGDYEGDASKIKDLVRGTIEVPNNADADAVIAALHQKYGEPIKSAGSLDPDQPALPNGYRGINTVWIVDGRPAEVQINLPEMLAAKEQAHPLYEQYEALRRKIGSREPTAAERSELDRLDAEQAAIYQPAWDAASRRMNSSRGSDAAISSEKNIPGRILPPGQARATWPSSDASRPSASTPNTALGENSGSEVGRTNASDMATTSSKIVTQSPNPGDFVPFPPDSGTIGIPRAEMPQIKRPDRSDFLDFLTSRGVNHQDAEVPASSLRPTQAEFSPAMVERFMQGGPRDRRVLVSSDGYVLDGHHQLLAHQRSGADIPVTRIDMPIRDLLGAANEYPKVQRSSGAADVAPESTPPVAGDATHAGADNPVIELPVTDLKLSDDVPQFKSGANSEGVVEPLGGKFDRRGTGPIQVWRRNDGRLEVISGRHRLDLARRSGEQTIPAQVYDEAAGFDQRQAAALDAELNIRDGQGKVADYVQYFQSPAFDGAEGRQTAESRGLLARATGRRAYTIASQGDPELIAAHRAGQLSDEAAVQIAQAAPNDARLQALGMRQIQKGSSITSSVNTMRALGSMRGDRATQGEIFDFDDSAIRDAEAMGKVAATHLADINKRLSAITGAAKRPELARAEGIDVRDPEAIQRRIGELRAERESWENWGTNSEKVALVRQEAGLKPMPERREAPTEPEPPPVDDRTPQMFSRDAGDRGTSDMFGAPTARERVRAAQEAKDAARNGRAGGREDTGDGGLFDGQRPEQADIEGPRRSQERTPAPRRFDASQVREAATKAWGSRFIKRLENAGVLHIIDTDRAVGLGLGSRGELRGVNGLYSDGKAYLLADQIRNLEDIRGIVVHEAGLHFGYDRLTTSDDRLALRNRVNRAMAAGDPDVVRAWRHAEQVGTPARSMHEETMAYLVQHSPGHRLVSRLVDAVKRGLNRVGVPMKLLESDSEAIRRTARDMLRRAAKGEKPTRAKVDANGAEDFRASTVNGVPVFSRDSATRAAYDQRIDELFDGAPARQKGVRLLDEGDVLTLTGYGKMPVVLAEHHAIHEGGDNHPLTREQWKKMPEWIDNPAAVFERTRDRRLTIIGPEKVNGHAVIIGLRPEASAGRGEGENHLVLTAYEKHHGKLPLRNRVELGDLKPLYVDQKKAPSFYADTGVQFPGSGVELRGFNRDLKTNRDLVKYRAERDAGVRHSRDLLGDESSQTAQARREAAAAHATVMNRLAAEGYPQGAIGWTGDPNAYTGVRGAVQRAVANFVDRYDPIKQIQLAIGGGDAAAVGDMANVYRLENLMHGRVGDQLNTLDRAEVRPLIKSMRQLRISSDLLNDYLLARHAPERNQRIASINKELPDGGSGVATQAAKDFMAGKSEGWYSGEKLTPERREQLAMLAKRVDSIRDETLNRLEASGQITSQLAAQLRKLWKYYVPLRGKSATEPGAGEVHGGGFGAGLNIRGKPFQRALGRGEGNLPPPNMLGEIIGDAQRSIIQGEKARVGRALLRLAMKHPNPDVWQVEPVDLEWRFSESTGEAYLGTKKPSNDKDVLTVVHNGTPYHVRLVDPRLQDAILNLDGKKAEFMVNWIGKMNRWLSAAFTRYNPAFMPINMMRDMLLGSVSMTAEHGPAQAAATMKHYLPAMRAAWSDFGNGRRGDASVPDAQKKMEDWAREYAENGGKTGIGMSEAPDVIARNISDGVKTGLQILGETTLHPSTWGKPAQATGRALGYLKPVVDLVERANDATENAMRLAAYVTRRKAGATPEAAADYAKNITVNFNRKGKWGPVLNSLFLFYNASVQGTRRVVQLVREHPKGMAAFLGSIAALQAQQATVLMSRKGDDGISDWDAIPDWKKSTALIIALPGKGNYFALPMPYEFGFLTYAGGRLMQSVLEHDPSQKRDSLVADLGAGLLHSFSPVPLEQGLTGLVPAPLQAFMSVRANKDDLGREITFGEDPNGYDKPQSSLGRPGVPEPYVWLSRALNRAGGGDPDWRPPTLAPSVTDVSPDALQYLGNFFTGGLGSFVSGSWRSTQSVLAGVYTERQDGQVHVDWSKLARDLPIVSRFGIRTNTNRARSDRFYDIRDEIGRTKAMIQDKLDHGDIAGAEQVAKEAGIFGDGWTIGMRRDGRPSTRVHNVDGRPTRTLTLETVPGTMAGAYHEAEYGINVRRGGQSIMVQPGVRDYNRMIHADMGLPGIQRERAVKDLQDQRGGLMGAFLRFYEMRQDQLEQRTPNP